MKRSLFPTSVVTKAFTWAYQELGLNIKQASEILGISPSSLAQTTLLGFESGTAEYRKQLAFIRMYHLLISLSEGDSEQMKVWFSSYNVTLEKSPYEMCKEYDGIERVADQLRRLKQSESGRQSALAVIEFSQSDQHSKLRTLLH
ncbi:hypothetical protein KUL156_11270 [Alteromonas sp. KUL156]|uniref:hypothetical protein n=1 Tax=Alteromonas sp. KUL106 TaxID=2480799 RepID=UPI0012E69935|nr:hypothetical protein [Alteromonas sp. KUL106]GFD69326.1 hypothetical protein KUL106_25890 [Alteromonas sp. KUL106]GFD83373.1 hypothetical protein KUL118_62350 [Tenacibaculum sp. KUL118]GFD95610.1 hypothetical protein KUL154_43430 [Alteromonas sp. KUL154]GFD98534.1 hypothetical protein KUL156_11270 [Alteromonas sp. KUL156]